MNLVGVLPSKASLHWSSVSKQAVTVVEVRAACKDQTVTLANGDEPSDVFEYIRLSLVGSAFGCFWREGVSPIDS